MDLAKKVSDEVEVFIEELSRTEIMRKSIDNYGYILVAKDMMRLLTQQMNKVNTWKLSLKSI